MSDEDVGKPHPLVQDVLTRVEQVELQVVEGRHFKEEPVYLDGREFRDCTFERCRLFIKLGVFTATNSNFLNSTFVMDGPANSLKNFIDMVYNQQGFRPPSA